MEEEDIEGEKKNEEAKNDKHWIHFTSCKMC